MKNLKTFENFVDQGKQYDGKVKALCSLWSFDPAVINAVYHGLGGDSFDQADEYLDLMDGEGTENPAEVWEQWQERYDIGHEPNPFETSNGEEE